MKKFRVLALLIYIFTFPILSCADSALHGFKSVFIGGASFSGKTNYTTYESNGANLGTTSDRANAYLDFAGELTYQSTFPFGVGFLVEGTRYEYQTGGSVGEIAFYAMPRLAHSMGPIEVWAGVGLGLMLNRLGGPNTTVEDGVTVTLTDMNSTSFAWSPRAGVDFDITDRAFVGAQVSYTKTVFSVPYEAVGSSAINGTIDSSRSWLGAALRIGSRF